MLPSSSSIPMWLEKILSMTLMFLYLLRIVLWPILWSDIGNVPGVLEQNM